jgi:hypothetical protein
MTITIDRTGSYRNATSHTQVLRGLAVDFARLAVKGTTPLTNNTGGNSSFLAVAVSGVNTPVSGTNLAQKAATETALGTVLDALSEVYAFANGVAAKLGIPTVTYSGGGAAADGTVGAVAASTTGAATGCTKAGFDPVLAKLNDAFYNAAALTAKIAEATGVKHDKIVLTGKLSGSVSAISTDTGAAAATALTKATVDAALSVFQDNAHALIAVLNAAVAVHTPGVLAVE